MTCEAGNKTHPGAEGVDVVDEEFQTVEDHGAPSARPWRSLPGCPCPG